MQALVHPAPQGALAHRMVGLAILLCDDILQVAHQRGSIFIAGGCLGVFIEGVQGFSVYAARWRP